MTDGNPNSKLLIVSPAPDNASIAAQKPLVGAVGIFLWRYLTSAGLDRADCYIVNCIGEVGEGTSGSPNKEQLARYWDEFNSAVLAFSGRVCVVLGGDALRRFTGITEGGIDAWRGYLISPSEFRSQSRTVEEHTTWKKDCKSGKQGNPRVIRHRVSEAPIVPTNLEITAPTLHPAGIMRSQFSTTPAFVADLKRCVRAINGNLRPYRDDYSEAINVPDSSWTETSPIAFDIETQSMESDAIARIGLAEESGTTTVLWDHAARQVTEASLNSVDRVKIAHNISFDLPRLEDAGIQIPDPIFDTMLAALMVQPDLYKGLNAVASLYLDCPRWKHEADNNPAFYNARDASATLELYAGLSDILAHTGQLDLFQNTIMPTVRTLMRMSRRGIRVDETRRAEWVESLRRDLSIAQEKWEKLSGGVNPNSPQQVQGYLYGTLRLPARSNKYGGISTDEGALRELAFEYPEHSAIFTSLLEIRGLGKDLKTYASGTTDRIHPQFLPVQKDDNKLDFDGQPVGKGLAGTWRITAKNPNIQNQPQVARKLYVPDNPNLVLLECDYNAIEARIIAALAGDEVLQQAIDNGLHDFNAKTLGVDKTRAKNAFYGWSYRGGAQTLRRTFRAKGYDVPFSECQRLLKDLSKTFHKTEAYAYGLVAQASREYRITNPFGLRRYWYHSHAGPAAANFMPQSTAAIIMWKVLRPLEAFVETQGGNILATIHDSVLFQVPKVGIAQTQRGIQEIMEQEFPEVAPGFRVPIASKTGENWGEMK